VHTFSNGVRVYDDHLLEKQRARYQKNNVHEAEEEAIFSQLIDSLPEKACYLNIGAAIGYYSILGAKRRPDLSIHAVEPLPRHRAWMRENILLNNLPEEHIRIHSVGVDAVNGKAKLIDQAYGSGIAPKEKVPIGKMLITRMRNAKARMQGKKLPATISIVTRSLDNLLEDLPGKHAHLCQMDVQGLETEVLRGGFHALKEKRIGTFLIGTHSEEIHSRCLRILTDAGYHVLIDEYETKDQPDGIIVASIDTISLGTSSS
jgi:FkbM family methyltransferase